MELWIRSQSRQSLVKIDNVSITEQTKEKYIIDSGDWILGRYKSYKRALEVLDEIQNKLLKSKYDKATEDYGKHSDCKNTLIEISSSIYVYEMPEE